MRENYRVGKTETMRLLRHESCFDTDLRLRPCEKGTYEHSHMHGYVFSHFVVFFVAKVASVFSAVPGFSAKDVDAVHFFVKLAIVINSGDQSLVVMGTSHRSTLLFHQDSRDAAWIKWYRNTLVTFALQTEYYAL